MILSASRRTDIPAFYTPWFMNRLREGFLMVRNPMNYHQVSEISLSPEVIDAIVFWTKNAEPILPYLAEIGEKYPFYFQYTLNAYGNDTEPNLPPLEYKIKTFQKLSEEIGKQRLIWRYDPILINNRYQVEWHIAQFETMARRLAPYTSVCVISFIDIYEKIRPQIKPLAIRALTEAEMEQAADAFSRIAEQNGLVIRSCAEKINLERFGISHGCCIDGELLAKLTGWQLKAKKDPNQRMECGCVESVDIGQYNTCSHGCRYCYANFNPQSVKTFSGRHDPKSPLLVGNLEAIDKVTKRKMKTLKDYNGSQLSMF